MGRARRLLLAASALLVARGARRVGRRIVPVERPERGAERAVLVLLALTTLSALAFPVVYGLHGVPHRTQFLGASPGLAFLLAGTARIVPGTRLVVNAPLEEEYPERFRHLASFETGDAVDLARKLTELLALSPADRDELKRAGRKAVVDRWSWASVAQRLLA